MFRFGEACESRSPMPSSSPPLLSRLRSVCSARRATKANSEYEVLCTSRGQHSSRCQRLPIFLGSSENTQLDDHASVGHCGTAFQVAHKIAPLMPLSRQRRAQMPQSQRQSCSYCGEAVRPDTVGLCGNALQRNSVWSAGWSAAYGQHTPISRRTGRSIALAAALHWQQHGDSTCLDSEAV
jgi:hypothetical protein